MAVLHSFSIKYFFYDKIDLRLFILFDDIFQLVIKILDLKVSVSTLITNLILEKITNNQPLSQIGPVVNDILLIF